MSPMSKFIVNGGRPVIGRVSIQGSKNAALPILAATLLCTGKSKICRCSELSDIDASVDILRSLGCQCTVDDKCVEVDSGRVCEYTVSECLMSRMRSSIIYMGALLARCGRAEVSFPGGCELGSRPIDLHLSSLRLMGAEIDESGGYLHCEAPHGLHGAYIDLPVASVGTTENIILAAVTAEGRTVIRNAAREPEIVDLCAYLRQCGAKIDGDGQGVIAIDGVGRLRGTEYSVMPDRIAAVTYLAAAAITGGDVEVYDCRPEHMYPVLSYFEQAGCDLTVTDSSVRLRAYDRPRRFEVISTHVYPGFPTDAQPIMLAVSTVADGTSMFVENIFSCRYKYADRLQKMGAHIRISERVAVVEGVERLHGAKVSATDLRGGAAVLLAALAAEDTTVIDNICHIERGYEHIDDILNSLNADVKRVNDDVEQPNEPC